MEKVIRCLKCGYEQIELNDLKDEYFCSNCKRKLLPITIINAESLKKEDMVDGYTEINHKADLVKEIKELKIRLSRLETSLDFFDALRESVFKIRDKIEELEKERDE